jgi:uncharacterized membrane protein HdeD (DUF308 family)
MPVSVQALFSAMAGVDRGVSRLAPSKCSDKRIMLSASYIIAASSIFGATFYVYFRSHLFLTATTMLLGSLLLIYGAQYIIYMLTEGERTFLLGRLLGEIGATQPVFPNIKITEPDFNAVAISMNLSIALMYAGIIAGIDLSIEYFPGQSALWMLRW